MDEKLIDHFFGQNEVIRKEDWFVLNKTEAKALQVFLIDNGYISREFHEPVHELLNRLNKFIGD